MAPSIKELKEYEEKCRSFSDEELQYHSNTQSVREYLLITLKEINGRQEKKEQQAHDDNKKIKNYTIAIFILTLLILIITLLQFFK